MDNTGAILVEQGSHPALLNSVEQSIQARERNRPRLSASQEIDPRTVPRYDPSQQSGPNYATIARSTPRRSSEEEETQRHYLLSPRAAPHPRTLQNYAVVARLTPRRSSEEEESRRPYSLFPRASPQPSSSVRDHVINARTIPTTFSLSADLPSNARKFGQRPSCEDNDTLLPKVLSEFTRSKTTDAYGSNSTKIFTSCSPSRAEELPSHGAVDARAGCDSRFSEDMAKAPQPRGRDDGPSSNPVSLQQHGSAGNDDEVPLNQDAPLQQASQIEGPLESKLAGSTLKSLS